MVRSKPVVFGSLDKNPIVTLIEESRPKTEIDPLPNVDHQKPAASQTSINTAKQMFSNQTTVNNRSQVSASFLNKNKIFINNCKNNMAGSSGSGVSTKNESKEASKNLIVEALSSASNSPSLQSFSSSGSISLTSSSSSASSTSSSYSKLASHPAKSTKVAHVGSIYKLNNPFLNNCKKTKRIFTQLNSKLQITIHRY
jgi:hypothetical protein